MSESFFVNYTEPRETALREANVPFNLFSIRGQRGFVFESAHREQALTAFRSQVYREQESEYEGIIVLHLRRGTSTPPSESEPAPPEAKITFEGVSEEDTTAREFKEVIKSFDSQLKQRNVTVVKPTHDRFALSPRTEDLNTITVFIWSAAAGPQPRTAVDQNGNPSPHRLWNLQCTYRPGYWIPWRSTNLGFVIYDTDGVEVGEVIDNNLYIFYPLFNVDFENKVKIFKKILEEAIPLLGMSEEEKTAALNKKADEKKKQESEKEEREKAAREARKPESRLEYIKACSGRYLRTLAGTKESLTTGRTEIERLQAELTRKIRETIGYERKLKQMELERSSIDDAYGKEFDNLYRIPKVLEVLAQNGTIKIFTDTLYCVDPRSSKKHEIGRFRIEIRSNGIVKMYNLTRKVSDMNAPHVNSDGDPCLGNISEIVPELAGNYEFAALAMVCIQYLESVNVNDAAGKYINEWPVVKENSNG